jgi:FixJ family two-component response regulator
VRFLGSDPTPFISAREARAYIEGARPRIAAVVTDLEMPEIDGEMLARDVRRIDASLPILLVTGAAEPRLAIARDSGLFVDVIGKACDHGSLIDAISRSLKAPPDEA